MATIAGKQSISRAISRRLSRARSRDVLVSRRNSVVIGVSVQEATVEHHLEEEEEEERGGESAASTVGGEGVVDMDKTRPRSRAAVYVGNNMPMSASPNGVLRKEKSSPGLNMGGMGEKQGWMSRAKDLTAKFKRKSIAALSQSAR